MWPSGHHVVLYLLERADKIQPFVPGSHNGCLTYVNESNSLRQTKQERQSTAGGTTVAAGLAVCDVTGAADLNAEHTEAPLNAKAKCCERTVFLITPPATAQASMHPSIPEQQHRVHVPKCRHAWPLLLRSESNESSQTALERRGDTTTSNQAPEVTPLLLQGQLHELRAGAGRQKSPRKRTLSCQQVPLADHRQVLLQHTLT